MKFDVQPREYPGCCDGEGTEKEQPTIWLDDILPAEIIKQLNVGQDFSITLNGKIKTLSTRETEGEKTGTEIRLSVESGEYENDGDSAEFAELSDVD